MKKKSQKSASKKPASRKPGTSKSAAGKSTTKGTKKAPSGKTVTKRAPTKKKKKKTARTRKGAGAIHATSQITGSDPSRKDFFFEGEGSTAFAAAAEAKRDRIDLDILPALKQDHDSLREFIQVLKDENAGLSEKKDAFQDFSVLLKSHSKSEEETVYRPCKEVSKMKDDALEGFEEHALAEELMLKAEDTKDDDQWRARVKVLAELVEHHIQEEESDLFPEIEKQLTHDEREEMSQNFIHFREGTQISRTSENAGVLGNL